jgi:CheY-like chemotaxis protein
MKILIIEDDQLVANIYRNKFAHEGFQAEIASNGDLGIKLVDSFRPDVILLDLLLPGATGLEVMRHVRAQQEFAKVPIIVFSNTYLSQLLQDAWKAGATKCLSKTHSTPRQVIEAVRSAIQESGMALPEPGLKPVQPQIVAPSATGENGDEEDAGFEAKLRDDLIAELPAILTELRNSLKGLTRADKDAERLKQIEHLYRRTHSLSSNAGIAGATEIALLADALEALLKELQDKPKNINTSTLRTVALAI